VVGVAVNVADFVIAQMHAYAAAASAHIASGSAHLELGVHGRCPNWVV
jgi:hypothetical protein